MTSEARDVLHAALALPVDDRAGVAAALLASLDGGDDGGVDAEAVEAAWVAELGSRAARVSSGQSAGTPWEEVRARVVGELAQG